VASIAAVKQEAEPSALDRAGHDGAVGRVGQADRGIVANRGEGFQCHVAPLAGSFVGLPDQKCANRTKAGAFGLKDDDPIRSPFHCGTDT
jgi:hypothetical protein